MLKNVEKFVRYIAQNDEKRATEQLKSILKEKITEKINDTIDED